MYNIKIFKDYWLFLSILEYFNIRLFSLQNDFLDFCLPAQILLFGYYSLHLMKIFFGMY